MLHRVSTHANDSSPQDLKRVPFLSSESCIKVLYDDHYDCLLAFASSDDLIRRGCAGIFHLQSAAYYKALVNAPDSRLAQVLPGLKASDYRQFKVASHRVVREC